MKILEFGCMHTNKIVFLFFLTWGIFIFIVLYFSKILKKKQVYLISKDFFGKSIKNKKILFFEGWKLFEKYYVWNYLRVSLAKAQKIRK
jgi:uncharacterized membrane protein SpoIIM required for sporulation